jgi:hypothetical protein
MMAAIEGGAVRPPEPRKLPKADPSRFLSPRSAVIGGNCPRSCFAVASWFGFQTKISLIGPSPSSINFMVRPMTGSSIFVWSSPSWCTIVACKSL